MAQVLHHKRNGSPRWVALAAVVGVVALAAAAFALASSGGGGVVVERSDVATTSASTASDGSPDGAGADIDASTGASVNGGSAAATQASAILVHVDGAVAAPGVYELKETARVNDAVQAAGGLTDDADTSSVNLAATLADGSKVHIPAQGEAVEQSSSSAGDSGAGASSSSSSGLININTASAEELDALPGVGPSTAASIVEDRERNGPFASPEDLMRVSGIGEKKFAKLQASICV